MKLFVDENLPPQLARGLAALFKGDHEVTCHRDKFGQRCRLDEEWMVELGREGEWVILSGDVNIARKRPQRELFFRSNLVGFFPRAGVMELPLPKKAARVLSVWDRMVSIARDVRPGVFELQQRGDQFKAL